MAMRAHMVLLSDRGCPPSEIADLHAVSHPTVYKWIDRFDEEDPSGLKVPPACMTESAKGVRASSAKRQGRRSSGSWKEIRPRRGRTRLGGRLPALQSTSKESSASTSMKTRFEAP